MSHDRLILGLMFLTVTGLVLNWQEVRPSDFDDIMARLRHECDPANPDADYYWSQRSMPTERKRDAIIADCRKLGPVLVPKVRHQLALETDEEIRGMLTVIAAALGDMDSVMPAAEQMVWSYYPAVRISAAKTLRRLHDWRTLKFFRFALKDDHFVVNGGCGTYREQFYPVRNLAQIAMREMNVEPVDEDEIRWRIKAVYEEVAERLRRKEIDEMRFQEIAHKEIEELMRSLRGK